MNANIQVKHLLPAWETFRRATNIAPIRDAAHYRRMVAMLEALLDEAGSNEKHPAMGLIDIVGDLIADYEAAHHPLPDVTGVQALFARHQCCHLPGELGALSFLCPMGSTAFQLSLKLNCYRFPAYPPGKNRKYATYCFCLIVFI